MLPVAAKSLATHQLHPKATQVILDHRRVEYISGAGEQLFFHSDAMKASLERGKDFGARCDCVYYAEPHYGFSKCDCHMFTKLRIILRERLKLFRL